MARHSELVKYGLYAVGAYFVYTKIWPSLSTELTSLKDSLLPTSTSLLSSALPSTAIASEFNPSGVASSSIYAINEPISASPVAGMASSPNINLGMGIYYITAQDSANITLFTPVNTIGLTFNQWSNYYRQAKGISLPLSSSDVGVDSNLQINLSQFTVLVNTHYPKPSLSGINLGYYGVQQNNSWYGVL